MKGRFSPIWRVAVALMLVLSFSLVTAVPASAAGTLTSVSATTDNSTVGATANYTLAFTTATTGNITTIVMAFATGFEVSGATKGTVDGIGDGTISKSGDNVTYNVTSPVVVADNVSVSIGLSIIVNPSAPGSYNITITTKDLGTEIDTKTTSLTLDPGPIDHFSLATEHAGTEVAGTAFSVNVTAQDQYNNTATSYNGTAVSIAFTSTATAAPDDTSPTIPTPQSLNFSVTPGIVTATGFILVDAGETPTIAASDGTYTGIFSAITVNPATAASLGVTDVTDPITKGASSNVTVTAYDAYQNVATSYNGTIAFTSTDTAPATLPSNFTFVPATDNGTHIFTGGVTFNTVGQHSVTATDNVTGAITGTQSGIGVYDTLITLNADAWTLISTDNYIISSGDNTSAFEGSVSLKYKYTGSSYLPATVADIKPVEALYVKTTDDDGLVGLNYSTTSSPGASNKDLVAGWNLISSANSTAAGAVLSPLRYVQIGEQEGTGLATLVSQGNYNQNTRSLYLPTLLEGDWTTLGTITLDPFDGYWVYMNAAKSFGVLPLD